MKWFKILIEVENCWLEVEGINKLAGAFTTRGAVATTEEEAKIIVEGQLKEELHNHFTNHSQNALTFSFREISECTHQKIASLPKSGFTWYLVDVP